MRDIWEQPEPITTYPRGIMMMIRTLGAAGRAASARELRETDFMRPRVTVQEEEEEEEEEEGLFRANAVNERRRRKVYSELTQ